MPRLGGRGRRRYGFRRVRSGRFVLGGGRGRFGGIRGRVRGAVVQNGGFAVLYLPGVWWILLVVIHGVIYLSKMVGRTEEKAHGAKQEDYSNYHVKNVICDGWRADLPHDKKDNSEDDANADEKPK